MDAPIQSQTLYINNINEKIKKNVLKKMLYMVFSQYGKVIAINASKGLKLRGQAWVVFEDVNAATNAMRGKQGFNFYGKPLKIAFAISKSNVVQNKENLEASRGKNKRSRDNDDAGPASKKSLGQANKILFAQGLPTSMTEDTLKSFFQQAQGFLEIRVPPGESHQGTAFLEFVDESFATLAIKQLNGFQLSPTDSLQLSFSN